MWQEGQSGDKCPQGDQALMAPPACSIPGSLGRFLTEPGAGLGDDPQLCCSSQSRAKNPCFLSAWGSTMCGQRDLEQQNKGHSLWPVRDFGDAPGVLPLPEGDVGFSRDPARIQGATLLLFCSSKPGLLLDLPLLPGGSIPEGSIPGADSSRGDPSRGDPSLGKSIPGRGRCGIQPGFSQDSGSHAPALLLFQAWVAPGASPAPWGDPSLRDAAPGGARGVLNFVPSLPQALEGISALP